MKQYVAVPYPATHVVLAVGIGTELAGASESMLLLLLMAVVVVSEAEAVTASVLPVVKGELTGTSESVLLLLLLLLSEAEAVTASVLPVVKGELDAVMVEVKVCGVGKLLIGYTETGYDE
ncbi:hypothetical protein GGS20DRAFT_545847 [Poronia punctata]|nr:hypothetical protein GGS20DRAFT_545847 [Poronia punctata]